ncbi:acyl-CoA dehydrogenase [Comamonas serinivorans]|uniref:Acyl-CoA dehydrogenase n=1 Tax=Comamonas serinivorans TaxID=1082851 RepID=A0A1Y0ER44_9BURK|nr:MaoC family dehydratase N-terminal domain-containing protein [Comamonas serinivorans]ARU05722.1 acyl-CoA dehydrogenase [Comamonas serinivorans]
MNTTADVRNLDADTLAHLQQWVGKSQTQHDTAAAPAVSGLSATLDRDDPAPTTGTEVAPLGHWLYFLPQALQREIGPDGHPNRGGFMPPVPLPRRMWAGGRLSWEEGNRLKVGDAITRTSTIESVTHKAGRTGDLLFVVVKHVVSNAQGVCVTEEQDIVYRAAAQPGDKAPAPTMAETGAPWRREIVPDPVMLFRYSALTFNGHRIHYDRPYTTQEEGYAGLVVHGPLIATLLTDLVRRHAPDAFIKRFAFKAVRPTLDINRFWVNGQPDGKAVKVWGNDHEGALTMQATIELA